MAVAVERLRTRPEFLRVAAARRKWAAPGLVLQARPRVDDPDAPARVGFTATRKIGGAVVRNRARRRLRAAVRAVLPGAAEPGWDYVVIAREATVTRPYPELLDDLATALRRVARPRGAARAETAAPSPAAAG